MQQLSGLDASFLYMETANAPMHISGLSIYDQSTAPGGKVRFKELLENFRTRVSALPVMSRRLVTVPLGLDHPYWVNDGTFDAEFHIRHIALPKPGDWRQLCILVSRLNARPLDRARPLWEAYVIEGLDGIAGLPKGCFAIFSKTHHAAIDGTSGMEMTAATHDLSPDYSTYESPAPLQAEDEPSTLGLLLRAQINTIREPFRFLRVAGHTAPGILKVAWRLGRGELHRVTDIPRTRFNGKVSPYRVFDAVTLSLQDIKTIKNGVEGATVNDVAIAICGGALRNYLLARGELPEQSLAAMAPVSVRSDADSSGGNLVSAMTVMVRSDVENALERLRAVRDASRDAKELTNAIGAKTMTDYTQFIPSTLTAQAARLSSRIGLSNYISPAYNCVITNVPGPQVPLYSTGARMVTGFGTGPVMDGLGLFHAIGSYCGKFMISATACRNMMPDPGFYRECLQSSFDDLLAASLASRRPAKAGAAQRPKRKKRR